MDRKRIGLALSGGVARGPAHVGVLTVLDREAIPIDCIAGTSAGALVGALYCAGIPITRATELLQHFGWREIASPVWPNRGFVSFAKLESWLHQLVGDIQFSDLRKPLAVVATDLNTGRPVVFREGPVIPAVHASCAVPGFVQSVALEARWLGDGGASANLPVRATRALGADLVVGVDLFLPNSWRGWGPFGVGMVALENLIRQSGGGLDQADLLITPELSDISYFRFGRTEAKVLKGQLAAEAKLAELKALIAAPPGGVPSV